MKYLFIFWKPVLWFALICYTLLIPAEDIPMSPLLKIPHFDKIVHFTLFFVYCLLLIRSFRKTALNQWIFAPLTALIFSALLELGQHTMSVSRSSNFYDFIANAAGVLSAILFYSLFVSNRKWEKLF